MKTEKIILGWAYLLECGLVLIPISRWSDGLILFERSEGPTQFAYGLVKKIKFVNKIYVGGK